MDNQQLVIGGTNIAIGDTNPLFRRRRSQREAGQASLEQLPNVHNRSRIIGRIGKIRAHLSLEPNVRNMLSVLKSDQDALWPC